MNGEKKNIFERIYMTQFSSGVLSHADIIAWNFFFSYGFQLMIEKE